jgi:hypothetical protein
MLTPERKYQLQTGGEPQTPEELAHIREHVGNCKRDNRAPPPEPRRACSQQFIDLYTDGAGHCFSDADEGL